MKASRILVVGLLVAVAAVSLAQEAKKKKVPSRWRRLPPHFSKVVTEAQREKIYEIRERHGVEIETLEKQISAIEKTRDDETNSVLNSAQLELVQKIAAEAEKIRAAKEKLKKN